MRRVGSTNSVLLLSAFGPSEGAEFSIPHERSLAMSDMIKVLWRLFAGRRVEVVSGIRYFTF